MASFDDPLPTIAFPHELDNLVLTTNDGAPLPIAVRLGGQYGSDLLSTTLHPSADGEVELYDLADLLRDHCEPARLNTLYFALDDHSETTLVLPSRTDLAHTAADFLSAHFLTLLDGAKPTYLGAMEYLSYYAPRNILEPLPPAPAITCLWVNPNSGETQETAGKYRTIVGQGANLYTLYLNSADFLAPAEGFLLHSFRVEVESRSQDYLLQTPIDATPLTLRFHNNFGFNETFHFFGTTEKELKPTRSTASFRGQTRNYRVEAVPTWKCHTGVLPPSVQPLFADLCAATHLWRQDTGEALTILDDDYKLSNDRYEVQTGTLTFREAARTARYKKQNVPQEVFDATFDETFK